MDGASAQPKAHCRSLLRRPHAHLLETCSFRVRRHLFRQLGRRGSTVNCYSPADGTVEIRYPSHCHGIIVSDDEAATIRRRAIEQRRRALETTPPPMDPALKLVGAGTGFFITRYADVLTNAHVVEKCSAVSVEMTNGAVEQAAVVAADRQDDLAILRTNLQPGEIAAFRAGVAMTGQEVAVIGYPDRGMPAIQPILVPGMMPQQAGPLPDRLRFKGDVRPGNSGGPLLDDNGLVVGVVVGGVNSVATFQATAHMVRDVGLAISNDVVLRFLDRGHVEAVIVAERVRLTGHDLERHARSFVVRVGCWR